MNKKIISLVLALVMVLGSFTSVFAAETKKDDAKAESKEKVEKVVGKDNKIQYIIDKKLVEGYEDGNYGLDKNIKRSEITRLLVLANGNEELSKQLQGSMQVYNDVKPEHWANGVITVGTTVPSDANGIAMLAGYPDGSFKPENDVTYAELAKMLVVLAKEDLTADMVKNATWASSWMTWAAQLGILDDVTIADSNKAANRADAFTMIYNALYKMQEFKRTPSNETRGIVSNLTNSKLTLNQDKDKEYKITSDTVIVDGDNGRKQIVKVKTVDNLDLYKGSLVRILTNDKNEVTHILELGNPEDLAKSNRNGLLDEDNNIWEGVADATVKTDYYKDIVTMKDVKQKDINKAYATIKLNSSATKGKYIKFFDAKEKPIRELKINDKTEVYVANPYNNIMREVKDINEALSLIGFHNYKDDYKIANVYAGFDTDDHKSAVKGYDSERNTARVIVFNVVSKDNDGDRYRVVQDSSSKYSNTLEDVDGKLYDRDNVLNKAHFPLNYGDKYDVIELRGDAIEKIIDHSETKDYPVVKVEKVFDNDEIKVIDRFDNETLLYVGDADIFNAKQYKDLEKGDYLQFAANDKNARDIDAVSIFEPSKYIEDKFDESGSVLNVVNGIEGHTVVGTIKWVGEKEVEIKVESDNWDKDLNKTTKTYKVDKELATVLKDYVGKEVIFKAENKKHDDNVRAYDFRLNDEKETPIKPKSKAGNVQDIKDEIKKLDAKYPDQESVNKDFDNAKKSVEKIQKMIDDLKFEDKTEWEGVDKSYKEALDRVKGFVDTKEEAVKKEYTEQIKAVKDAADAKLTDVKVAKDTLTQDKAKAEVKAIVDKELKDGVTAKYEVESFDNVQKQVKIKVTFEKAPADAQTSEVIVTEEA